jgi:hypothetical protein
MSFKDFSTSQKAPGKSGGADKTKEASTAATPAAAQKPAPAAKS